jgi:hypothetical protein
MATPDHGGEGQGGGVGRGEGRGERWRFPGRSFRLEWEGPPPRPGLRGYWDLLVGPGAERSEVRLWLGVAFATAALSVAYPLASGAPWAWWQLALAAVLAFDVCGGVAVTASTPAKRWYHRHGEGARAKAAFVAGHLPHGAAVALLFHPEPASYFLAYALVLAPATAAVLLAGIYIRRPVAMVATATGIFVLVAWPGPTPWLEWFEPMILMKLIAGHLVFEAPFRAPPRGGG